MEEELEMNNIIDDFNNDKESHTSYSISSENNSTISNTFIIYNYK